MSDPSRPLAIVTGAFSGIGLELAKLAIEQGYDLTIAADERDIHEAARTLKAQGAKVQAVQASTTEGVDQRYDAPRDLGRPVEILIANAGCGLGHAFLDQDIDEAKRVVDINIVAIYLTQKVGCDMREPNRGKILLTGSVAGFMPGSRFFERADMLDTNVGQQEKVDPADVESRLGRDDAGRWRHCQRPETKSSPQSPTVRQRACLPSSIGRWPSPVRLTTSA